MILAFDFGGTKLSAACVPTADPGGTWHNRQRIFSPEGADARYEIDTMIRLGHEMMAGQKPAAIGVSFGGPVEFNKGLVRLSHHVPGWENCTLQTILEDEFDVPVRVDNDANVAALGEHRFGAGRGFQDLMYLTVSTGVGGGWILNGRPWRGHEGMAGEIGHMAVDPNGPLCLCGKRGCVERLASGPYMAADYAEERRGRGEEGGERKEERGEEEPRAVTGRVVAELAGVGDALAQQILLRGAWALGMGIGNAANLLNPQLFVLGGGVTKAGEMWWTAVREAAQQTALPEVQFDIVPAELGDDAPLWGAVALAAPVICNR
jgi:glucokinase